MPLCIFIVLCEVIWSPRELNQSNTTRLSDILKAKIDILIIAFLCKDRNEIRDLWLVLMLDISLFIRPFPADFR